MPRAFSDQEKERINARLLEQGEKLFSSYGLRKTNVEEIARAAGISKGAFYNFYASKEDLFMAVIERAEERARAWILAAIERPGPSPRARLYGVLKEAILSLKPLPALHAFTGGDIPLLLRAVPLETLQEHLANDLAFLAELIDRCRAVGIPIRAPAEQIAGLLYPLVPALLGEDIFGLSAFSSGADMLLELVAAFCLGEVELNLSTSSGSVQKDENEPVH